MGKVSISLFILFATVSVAMAASPLDAYTFLRASADERAVVRTPGGELQVIKPGDEVI